MRWDRFIADGRERLLQSPKLQAELDLAVAAIRERYAALLLTASPLRRLLLRYRMRREIRQAIEELAPHSADYVISGPTT